MAGSLQVFRTLVENGPDAISLVNKDGKILYGSLANAKLFGYQPDELVGRNCLELVHPEDRDYSKWALQEVLTNSPSPLQWEARLRHKEGNYSWVESRASNFPSETEARAIVVQRDINARRTAEATTQQKAEELSRSNLRFEEFAYTAAHDLREPLRAICAYSKLLLSKGMDADAREMAKFIADDALRMSTLVDDLLSFARTGAPGPFGNINLQHAVTQAMQNLAPAVEVCGGLVTMDRLPTVPGIESYLVRLFQNLIGNALKYRSENAPQIHVSAARLALDWVVKVRDNGLGIAGKNQTRIFLPFTRLANRDVPGSGLGLAVCKRIVEELGGTIWVESELGTGSTFCFTIAAKD